ncbi:hypothetical protein [Sphingobium sp.]|uniref:hypothetical protein n=1 Tax=Sphingobium sp. TaxID=1912891 RepID=UPI002C76074A|nr:hypothetical protein [Sphingobium sp.]HUD95602.1 hypothetical protein [Sphingobium sp.]
MTDSIEFVGELRSEQHQSADEDAKQQDNGGSESQSTPELQDRTDRTRQSIEDDSENDRGEDQEKEAGQLDDQETAPTMARMATVAVSILLSVQ